MEQTVICKNCGNKFTGKYCNQCGEKVHAEEDKTFSHLIHEGLHFITHFEGTLFTTLKTIFTKPGQLSLDYCDGVRKKYFKPLSFFLLLVVMYLIFPFFQGLNMSLSNYLNGTWYSDYARKEALDWVRSAHITEKYAAEHFHDVSGKVSKFLLFIIIPVLAAVCALLTIKKKRPFFDHIIFSTEINAFMILWGFLILPAIFLIIHLFTPNTVNDGILLILIMGGVGIYVFSALKRFYSLNNFPALLCTLAILVADALFIQYVYKFVLFFITIKLIHGF